MEPQIQGFFYISFRSDLMLMTWCHQSIGCRKTPPWSPAKNQQSTGRFVTIFPSTFWSWKIDDPGIFLKNVLECFWKMLILPVWNMWASEDTFGSHQFLMALRWFRNPGTHQYICYTYIIHIKKNMMMIIWWYIWYIWYIYWSPDIQYIPDIHYTHTLYLVMMITQKQKCFDSSVSSWSQKPLGNWPSAIDSDSQVFHTL